MQQPVLIDGALTSAYGWGPHLLCFSLSHFHSLPDSSELRVPGHEFESQIGTFTLELVCLSLKLLCFKTQGSVKVFKIYFLFYTCTICLLHINTT